MEINDMLAPDPIRLPADPGADSTDDLQAGLIGHPNSPLLWALLAEKELERLRSDEALPTAYITAYAYARTGYHRSLDRLRANGWKGWGPVPFSHEPNQGVLRAIAALAHTAQAIGEDDEYDRLRQMLSDADPDSVAALLD
ncbi:Hypothetical Protein NG00_00452 [Corynebacterium camporealensis]|uniref:Uncharacterized protein n=1 Tax=Corynebacterium camporealensis TaxID=161896 RepID=A0A0F6QVN6_9CORY|nr:DUF3151 domain-containing protein [Corynebacterium camporealensis]AKE38480.1 Protein of unknown function (DUF3151) [Corynebacterium camporealensis]AVH87780.1 Hypothetical Protein NG00_00452 [Corynebacterium camporealensis]